MLAKLKVSLHLVLIDSSCVILLRSLMLSLKKDRTNTISHINLTEEQQKIRGINIMHITLFLSFA